MITPPALQFGTALAGRTHLRRPTAFGLAFQDGKLACVRVDRGEGSYFDLPGGAVDGDETEAQALVREFIEETGLSIRPLERICDVAQYFLKTDGAPINNIGGVWTVEILSLDPAAKVEVDHELVWLSPYEALRQLRHEAHAWAIATWMRLKS